MTHAAIPPGDQVWLDQVIESPVDSARPIIDPHHHLWPTSGRLLYGPAHLAADTGAGHNIVATVFMECSAAYRADGPEHLRPVGETAFVAESADWLTAGQPAGPPIAGIIGHADLSDATHLDAVLDAHTEAAGGRFRGIRDALARATEPEVMMIAGMNPAGKFANPAFQAGVRRLGERGLTYDSWQYHHQNHELLELARAIPETTMVLDHFGTPCGVGQYEGHRDEIFEAWKADITALAACDNVVAKIGGLAMPDNGFGFHTAERPPTSDELVAAQSRYYLHTIEAFGPGRCMFESNFPVDRFSLPYTVFWNAAQKMVADFSDDDQNAMFSGTAARVYSIAV
jgi:L-fuconolactonase